MDNCIITSCITDSNIRTPVLSHQRVFRTLQHTQSIMGFYVQRCRRVVVYFLFFQGVEEDEEGDTGIAPAVTEKRLWLLSVTHTQSKQTGGETPIH